MTTKIFNYKKCNKKGGIVVANAGDGAAGRGPVFEAIDKAAEKGIKVQALYPRTLYPLPTDWIKNFIKNKEVIIVIEANYNAQFK